MNNNFDRMNWIPMRIPQTFGVENADLFSQFLSSSRVEIEFYLWVWAAVRLLETRRRIVNIIVLIGNLRWKFIKRVITLKPVHVVMRFVRSFSFTSRALT